MRFALLLTCCLSLTAPAAPPEVVPVPAPKVNEWTELKVSAGEVVVLSAQPASEWDVLDGSPPHTFESGKYAVFLLQAGDRLKVVVTGPDKSKTRLTLVGGASPPPKPPTPNDPLQAKLKAAYDADAGADKSESVKLLVELYKQLADRVCPDASIATVGELLGRCRDASGVLLKPEQLVGVRRVVAGELGLLFPADGPLSDEQRKRSSELFKRLAATLEGF